jgi:hypothetical protein
MFFSRTQRIRIREAILSICLLSGCAMANARVFYVDHDFQGETYDGTSWLSAFPSIQQAVDAAAGNGGGEIWVKAGVYKPEGSDRRASFLLKPGIKLYGGFRGHETSLTQANPKANRTILSGDIGRVSARTDNTYHVVTGAAECRIDGFIIVAGYADQPEEQGRGGGLLLDSDAVNFTALNCTFEKNHAGNGGGLFTAAQGTTLSNCTFYSNSAELGGAAFLDKGAQVRVENCSFSSNYSKQGGGAVAMFSGTTAHFSRSWFLYNSTDGNGGALSSTTDQKNGIELALFECVFNENSARETGGALFNRGTFYPDLTQCRFTKNFSARGAGVMANRNKVTVILSDCTLTRNRSATDIEDIDNDETSLVTDAASPRLSSTKTSTLPTQEKAMPKPSPKPKQKRQLKDVFVINNSGMKVKLRSIVAAGDYTVLTTGDITDPVFLSNYREIEAAAKDYSPLGVNFFYIYRYLAHPENNRYIQPFTLRERARHVQQAMTLLHTRIPWLCDTMDNRTAQMLEHGANTLFIYNKSGVEEFAGRITDRSAFRSALSGLVGRTANQTTAQSFPPAEITPLNVPVAKVVKRPDINPRNERYKALQITPMNTRQPFYVKLRVEAREDLLKTGDGRMYLGFHIDPIYPVSWNNLGETVNYAITVPRGTAISPSINQARKVTRQATDTEPREFMLEVRKWNPSKPVPITVTYSVHALKRNHNISQKYLIYLHQDPFGGTVIGRQILPSEARTRIITKDVRTEETTATSLPRHLDLNLDGMLSRDEATPALLANWDDVDTDKNGKIDKQEYSRYQGRDSN